MLKPSRSNHSDWAMAGELETRMHCSVRHLLCSACMHVIGEVSAEPMAHGVRSILNRTRDKHHPHSTAGHQHDGAAW